MTTRRFILTGAPGVGKTALIRSLAARGIACIDEPAREIIAEQRAINGRGVWERDTLLFLELLLSRSLLRYKEASSTLTVYDRGIPDCIAYARCAGISFPAAETAATTFRYEAPVIIATPWREIYRTDEERTMTFEATCAFHTYLVEVYSALGYELVELPQTSVEARSNFVSSRIGFTGQRPRGR